MKKNISKLSKKIERSIPRAWWVAPPMPEVLLLLNLAGWSAYHYLTNILLVLVIGKGESLVKLRPPA